MTMEQLFEYFVGQAEWVDRAKTPDVIEFGDLQHEVTKIGVGWSACTANLQAAARDQCDLFITHEPSFCDVWGPEWALRETDWGKKRLQILQKNSLGLFALHDTWDVWPVFGIHDSWAETLGLERLLESEMPLPRLKISLFEVERLTLDEFTAQVAACVAEYGQYGVIVHGEPEHLVRKVAIGTGCCCPEYSMLNKGADVLIHVFDASQQTTLRLPLLDMGASIIEVEHSASEMPGMKNMAKYINNTFPDLSAKFYCEEPESRVVQSSG